MNTVAAKTMVTPAATSVRDLIRWPKVPITRPSTSSTMKKDGEISKSPLWSGPEPGSRKSDIARRSEPSKEAKVSFAHRMSDVFQSIDTSRQGLGDVGYLADESTALVSYLAGRLGKPVLVEGPAGVGKTELAKALSRATGRTLIRLQCYEGLDEAKALYEWNYRKQLLRIQADSAMERRPATDPAEPDATAEDSAGKVLGDIFAEEFLLTRPLLQAIAATEAVVLLIDEIDKTDQ